MADRRPRLHEETLALLRERLGSGSPALGFAAAVAEQVGRGARVVPDGEREAAERTAELLLGTRDGAADLAERPPLLAAFFQNVDLLYLAGDPRADAMSALVMAALERLAETEEG